MYHILYLSSAVAAMSADALRALLETSRRNNRRDEITGLLLYLDGNFLQYVEGPRPAVEALFTNIRRDRRHRRILVLEQGEGHGRVFPTWSMGFRDIGPAEADTAELFELTREALAARVPPDYPRFVRVFMETFYRANASSGGRR